MNSSGDKAGREGKLPRGWMKQEEMEQKFARMTTRDGPTEDAETSAAEGEQEAERSAECIGPWEPLLAMKEVMEAILVNLQQNTRAIQAVGDAVGDLERLHPCCTNHLGSKFSIAVIGYCQMSKFTFWNFPKDGPFFSEWT